MVYASSAGSSHSCVHGHPIKSIMHGLEMQTKHRDYIASCRQGNRGRPVRAGGVARPRPGRDRDGDGTGSTLVLVSGSVQGGALAHASISISAAGWRPRALAFPRGYHCIATLAGKFLFPFGGRKGVTPWFDLFFFFIVLGATTRGASVP